MKTIKALKLFDELKSDLKLEDLTRENPVLHESVQPVLDISNTIRRAYMPDQELITIDNVAKFVVYTPRKSEKLIIKAISIETASGTFTIDTLLIRGGPNLDIDVKLKTITAAANIYYFPADGSFQIDDTQQLLINVNAKTVNGAVTVSIFCEKYTEIIR